MLSKIKKILVDNKKNTLIVVLVIVIIALISLVIYLIDELDNTYLDDVSCPNVSCEEQSSVSKDLKKDEDTVEEEKTDNDNTEEDKYKNYSSDVLPFDDSKVINTTDLEYSHRFDTGFHEARIYYKDNNIFDVIVDWNDVKKYYGYDKPTDERYTISKIKFDKKVKDIFTGYFFQDMGSVYLFLMEDGTVEYMPLFDALKNNTIKSYGKIDGVEDAIGFYQVSAFPKNAVTGGFQTVLVQKSDGTYYDLIDFMNKKYDESMGR